MNFQSCKLFIPCIYGAVENSLFCCEACCGSGGGTFVFHSMSFVSKSGALCFFFIGG